MTKEMDIDELADEFNQRIAAITLAEAENGVVPRFNQSKTVACVNAEFRVHEDISEEFKHGVFSRPGIYQARLRFANASKADDSQKDIRGLSIRLSGVEGDVLWGETGFQDFLLNSYPVLFVPTPEDFLAFTRARQANKLLLFFLNPFDHHLQSLWILINSLKYTLSPLDIRYWSTVPYRLGDMGDQAVKYSVIPCSDYKTTQAVNPGENQLRAAIDAHLQQGPAFFQFAVQKCTDPYLMPIDNASAIWDENLSPFQTVATIKIEKQNFDNPDALADCEACSFNPWQSLAAHEPLGRMNLARRLIYPKAAALRNNKNKE